MRRSGVPQSRSSAAPRFALWLLRTLGCDETVVGDLVEESGRRPRWWFWHQTTHVVVSRIANEIRHHPVLTARAILLTWVMSNAVSVLFNEAGLSLVLLYAVRSPTFIRGHIPALTWISFSLIGFALIGWTMARFHSQVRIAATVIVVLLSVPAIAADPELHRLWGNLPESRFVPYFILHVVGAFTAPVALVIGAVLLPHRNWRWTGGTSPARR